jgi:hypothetical protein
MMMMPKKVLLDTTLSSNRNGNTNHNIYSNINGNANTTVNNHSNMFPIHQQEKPMIQFRPFHPILNNHTHYAVMPMYPINVHHPPPSTSSTHYPSQMLSKPLLLSSFTAASQLSNLSNASNINNSTASTTSTSTSSATTVYNFTPIHIQAKVQNSATTYSIGSKGKILKNN